MGMSLSHKVITISEHTYQLLKDHIFYIDSNSDNEKIILQSSSDAKKTKAFVYFYMLNEFANEGNLFNFVRVLLYNKVREGAMQKTAVNC